MTFFARLTTFCTTSPGETFGQFLGVTLQFHDEAELKEAENTDYIEYTKRFNALLPDSLYANDVLVLKKVETKKKHMCEGYRGPQSLCFT